MLKVLIFCLLIILNLNGAQQAPNLPSVINTSATLKLPGQLLSLPQILQALPGVSRTEALKVIRETAKETNNICKQLRITWNEESNQLMQRTQCLWNEESGEFFKRINESTNQISKNIANQITSVSNIIILKLLFAYIMFHGFTVFSQDSFNGILYMTFGFIGFMSVEKMLIMMDKYFYDKPESSIERINPYQNIVLDEEEIINFKKILKRHLKIKKLDENKILAFQELLRNKLNEQLQEEKPEESVSSMPLSSSSLGNIDSGEQISYEEVKRILEEE